jgi:hypothetical protein
MRTHRIILMLTACFLSSTALAQSAYVVGSIGADISRGRRAANEGFSPPGGGGEALSGALRLGVVPQDRWGIELEIAKSAEMTERSSTQRSPTIPDFIFFEGFGRVLDFEHRERAMTISTMGSARQRISASVELVYLGGVVFYRISEETRTAQVLRGLRILRPVELGLDLSFDSQTVSYGAGPVAGFEAHIGLGEHMRIVPGIRLHGIRSSWLVRPSVGLGWGF